MSFNDVAGQRLAVALIRRAISEKRTAHAYLFLGPDGVGKSLLAKNFAKALNCEGAGAEPCDACASCKKIEDGVHPDVHLVFPEGKSQRIKIDSIRQVSQALSLKPYEGKAKVCVIEGADEMTEEAANALLKTLEEPPAGSVLILLASNASRVYPTIMSRCQKIPFYPLSDKVISAELTHRFGAEEQRAAYIARFSEGRLGRAVEALRGGTFAKRDRMREEFLSPRRLGYDEPWLYNEPRGDVSDSLTALALYCRDLLVFNLSGDLDVLVNFDRADEIKRESRRYSVEKLQDMIETIGYVQELIRANANIKVALSYLRLNMA